MRGLQLRPKGNMFREVRSRSVLFLVHLVGITHVAGAAEAVSISDF